MHDRTANDCKAVAAWRAWLDALARGDAAAMHAAAQRMARAAS